jgi:hypothetical protein
MVVSLVLGGLCIFTDAWSNEMGQGQYIEEKILIRIA